MWIIWVVAGEQKYSIKWQANIIIKSLRFIGIIRKGALRNASSTDILLGKLAIPVYMHKSRNIPDTDVKDAIFIH